jgi:hypothetical protein
MKQDGRDMTMIFRNTCKTTIGNQTDMETQKFREVGPSPKIIDEIRIITSAFPKVLVIGKIRSVTSTFPKVLVR